MVNFVAAIGISVFLSPCLATQASQQTDPKISLTLQATTAKRALKELGRIASKTFETSPQTENEIIALRLQDVPLSDAMKRIAEAVDGAWKQEGDLFRLIRKPEQLRAEETKEFNDRVDWMQKVIRQRSDELQELPVWGAADARSLAAQTKKLASRYATNDPTGGWYRQASAFGAKTPIGRAIVQILAAMDTRELAGLSPNYNAVWSSNPTSTQRPMPKNAFVPIQKLMTDQAAWAEVADEFGMSGASSFPGVSWSGIFGQLRSMAKGGIATVLLTSRTWGSMDGRLFNLAAYDEKGRLLASTQAELRNPNDDTTGMRTLSSIPTREKKIVFEGDALTIVESFQSRSATPTKPLPRELIERLADPVRFDPLSVMISPELMQAAEIKHVNMVACLNDQLFYTPRWLPPSGLSVEEFLQQIDYQATTEFKDGWLIVKSAQPAHSREVRSDRKQLGMYLQRIRQGQRLSIDEQAKFALALPDPQASFLPLQLAGILGKANDIVYGHNMLCLYGQLTTEQKDLMTSRGLPLGSLTRSQSEHANRLVYSLNENLSYNPARAASGVSDQNSYVNGLMREVTESLPEGIPPNGVLKLQIDGGDVVVASDSRPEGSTLQIREISPYDLAKEKYVQDHVAQLGYVINEHMRLDLSKLQVGQRLKLTFTFQFTPALSLTRVLDDKSVGDIKIASIKELSGNFKKQFDLDYKQFASGAAGFQSPPTTSVPPP